MRTAGRIAIGMAVAVAGAAMAVPVLAQGDWKAERAAGRVGEQPDGYLGVVGATTPALQKTVADVNALRKEKYFAGAGDQTPALFAQITACSLITNLSPAEMYRTPAGAWKKRGTDAPELAALCPR